MQTSLFGPCRLAFIGQAPIALQHDACRAVTTSNWHRRTYLLSSLNIHDRHTSLHLR
jgi:hypothetical protein